jgi:hypothetical protein
MGRDKSLHVLLVIIGKHQVDVLVDIGASKFDVCNNNVRIGNYAT